MVNGAECVKKDGISMMQKFCAMNWAMVKQLKLNVLNFVDDTVMPEYGLMIYSVLALSGLLEIVYIKDGMYTIVNLMMLLV